MRKIAIETADAKDLRYYAGTILGLEVHKTENAASLRSKIDVARPGLTEIEVEDEAPTSAPTPAAAPALATAPGTAPGAAKPKPVAKTADGRVIPSGQAGLHPSFDPKVELLVFATSDPTKPKDVQVAVGGETILIQRDKQVRIPYRHYLVLDQSMESVARETGETNPQTGMPMKEWIEQKSYPHQIYGMPSKAEIEEWEKRTANIVMA